MSTWERQRQELDSYNLFYSSIEHKHKTVGLINHGFRLIGPFVKINDPWNSVAVEPDFALYDGSSLLCVEVKSGENVNDPSDIDQMDQYNELGKEAVEEFLKETPVSEERLKPIQLDTVDHVVVYYDEFIQKCRNEWEGCARALEKLEQVTPVLTQTPGGKLRLESGSLSNEKLERVLGNGIPLPKRAPKRVYLTENVESECLAFSVCYDIALNEIGSGPCVLTPSEVRNFYGRRIPISKVEMVFDFLEKIDACRRTPDGEYVFTEHHHQQILEVESKIRQQQVKDYLDDDHGQSDFSDFLGEE